MTIEAVSLPLKWARRRLGAAILFALLLSMFPFASQAQVPSFKQQAHTDYGNQTSGTFTFNAQLTSPGGIIVVSCIYKPLYGHCTSAPTDTEGNIYTLVSTKETANGNAGMKLYHALNIKGGTNNTVTCYSETITSVGCLGVEIAGANTLDVGSDLTQAAGNSTSAASPTVTTAQANELLLGFGGMNPGSGSTFAGYGAGWTGIVQGSQNAEYKLAALAGGYAATATIAAPDDWIMGIVSYYLAPPITLTLTPQTVAAGYDLSGKVVLGSPAPSGGALVTLSSNNTSVAATPASVLVPAGLTSATFTLSTSFATSSASANISATYNSANAVAALTAVPVNASPQYSIWSSSATPSVLDDGGTSPVEVGVKFTTSTSGFVSGIRFYKSVANTGTHIGNLWTSTGQLLSTATFTGETASGWQYANFPSPVLLTANTIYVASYHADAGHTSNDQAYFTNIGVDSAPLHAPSSATSAGNGVRALGAASSFPNVTSADSNYWVDVLFMTLFSPPQVQSLTLNPTTVVGGVANSNGTVTLTAAAPAGGVTVNLSSNLTAAATVPATVTVAAGQTVSPIFTVTSRSVNITTTPSISATANGSTQSANLTVNPVLAAGLPQIGNRIRVNSSANIRATAVNNGFGALLGTQPAGALGTVTALSNAIIPSTGGAVWIQVKFDSCSPSIPNCTGWMGSDNITNLTTQPSLAVNCVTAKQAFTAVNMPVGTVLTVTGTAGGKTASCSISLP